MSMAQLDKRKCAKGTGMSPFDPEATLVSPILRQRWLFAFVPKNLTISPLELFAEGMREQGHVKGRDFVLIVCTADGVLDRGVPRLRGPISEINAPKMRCGSTKITWLRWPRVSESPQQYRHQMPV